MTDDHTPTNKPENEVEANPSVTITLLDLIERIVDLETENRALRWALAEHQFRHGLSNLADKPFGLLDESD